MVVCWNVYHVAFFDILFYCMPCLHWVSFSVSFLCSLVSGKPFYSYLVRLDHRFPKVFLLDTSYFQKLLFNSDNIWILCRRIAFLSQRFLRFSFSLSISDTSRTKYVHAKFVCTRSLYIFVQGYLCMSIQGVSASRKAPMVSLSFL